MTRTVLIFILGVVAAAAVILVLLRAAVGMVRGVKQMPPGAAAFGWALLFLTSFRMPPPPPASQIETDVAGKKDREASRDVGKP